MVCVRVCGVHFGDLRGVVGACAGLCGSVLDLGGKGFGLRRGGGFGVWGVTGRVCGVVLWVFRVGGLCQGMGG